MAHETTVKTAYINICWHTQLHVLLKTNANVFIDCVGFKMQLRSNVKSFRECEIVMTCFSFLENDSSDIKV